jgi:hypothetical protein
MASPNARDQAGIALDQGWKLNDRRTQEPGAAYIAPSLD